MTTSNTGGALFILLVCAATIYICKWIDKQYDVCRPLCAPYAVHSALKGRCHCDLTTKVVEP